MSSVYDKLNNVLEGLRDDDKDVRKSYLAVGFTIVTYHQRHNLSYSEYIKLIDKYQTDIVKRYNGDQKFIKLLKLDYDDICKVVNNLYKQRNVRIPKPDGKYETYLVSIFANILQKIYNNNNNNPNPKRPRMSTSDNNGGLSNNSVTECFLNSLVQMLYSTDLFRNRCDRIPEKPQTREKIKEWLKRIVNERNPDFIDRRQQDLHELYMKLTHEPEFIKIFKDIAGFKTRMLDICKSSKHVTETIEPSDANSWNYQLQYTVLDHVLNVRCDDVLDTRECSECKGRVGAIRMYDILEGEYTPEGSIQGSIQVPLPKLLFVHNVLNGIRFPAPPLEHKIILHKQKIYNLRAIAVRSPGGSSGDEREMCLRCGKSPHDNGCTAKNVKCTVSGCPEPNKHNTVCHKLLYNGNSGHYYAVTKNNGDGWTKYDDSTVIQQDDLSEYDKNYWYYAMYELDRIMLY